MRTNRTQIEAAVAHALAKHPNATTHEAARIAVGTMIDTIAETLEHPGDRVHITDLGMFTSELVPARRVMNPATGKFTTAEPTARVRYKAVDSLKKRIMDANPQG